MSEQDHDISPHDRAPVPGARSPNWASVRRVYLNSHPTCEACGGKTQLQVHHVFPFHLRPQWELDTDNLITLCEDPSRLCHHRIGHAWDWHAYNIQCRHDAGLALKRVHERGYE